MAREYFEGKMRIDGRELPWISTFPKTAGFECTRCGFCCYGRVGLTAADLKDFARNGMEGLVDEAIPPKPGSPYDKMMKIKPNRACVNLTDKSLCSVYPKRPLVCRCFPFLVQASYNNDVVIDAILRCPYFDISGRAARAIDKRLLDAVASDYAKCVPHLMANTLDYYHTLVKHVQATVPAAFFPRDRKLAFMDKAIDMLKLDNPNDLAETAKNWAESISKASHVILASGIVEYEQMPSAEEMLSGVAFSPGKAGFSKRRLKEYISDFRNAFIYPGGGGIKASAIFCGTFGLKFVRNEGGSDVSSTIGFGKLASLDYTQEAVSLLKEYMKLLVRRASFQYCIARSAGFLTDYARMGVVDFELEVAVLANAVASNLDPVARAVAARAEKAEIDEEALRFAISNMDIGLTPGLVNDAVSNEIVSAVMRDTGVKRRAIF